MPSVLYSHFPKGVLQVSADTLAQLESVVGDFWVEVALCSNQSCLLAKELNLTPKLLGDHSLTQWSSVPI